MKYNAVLSDLYYAAATTSLDEGELEALLLRAAKAIEELQSTVVIVEVKENNDGT